MGPAALQLPMSASEFLAWEASQAFKHEFLGGEVFAMAGAADRHVTVAGNIHGALRQHLRHTPCRTYISDMKLRIDAADAASPLVKHEAILVVEVLSPGTAAHDLGAKFAAYRQLPSLREYLVVDTEARCCDLYRRGDDGLWVLHPSLDGQAVTFASVALELPAPALWDEVPPPG